MKNNLVVTFLIFLSLLSYAQSSKRYVKSPKDMVFVPQGSFNMQNNSSSKIITISAFWISNEITNKQFREFTDYAVLNPTDSIFWIKYDTIINSLNIKEYKISFTFQQILPDLIDTLAISKEYPINSERYNKYKKYYTDKTFDNYPVVGVSQKGARFYCMWKTQMENRKQGKNGYIIADYRLPLEEEWCYIADLCQDSELKGSDDIQIAKYGKHNKLGLFNVYGNVSEWTASLENQKKVVKGASWKNNQLNNQRLLFDQDTKTSYIGFRIVQTFLGGRKWH